MESHPIQLESLTIRRFRHLRGPAHLELGGGPILLVGRNGTGKTNLLRLIDAVTRLDFQELERDPHGLDIEFTLRWGELRLRMELVCDATAQPGRTKWRYRGTVADEGRHAAFSVWNGHIEPSREPPRPGERRFRGDLAFFVSAPGRVDHWVGPIHGRYGRTPLTGHTGRYDEALELFSAITSIELEGHASQMFIDHPTMDTAMGEPEFCPRSLARLLWDRDREARQAPVSGGELPFLKQAASVCGFEDLTCTAQIDREEPVHQQVNTTYAPFTLRARLADGSTISHHDFSFGQKRIAAFFWYLECVRDSQGAVVADELVNGMHHAAVRKLVDAMQGLQAFLASQNPLLFDYMEYKSPEEFQKRLILCEGGDRGGWRWRTPTPEESRRFFQAHDVGYQHVHEILRDEGLW